MPEEQKINTRLSFWSALTRCPCGRWTHQSSPGRSPEGICWERRGTEADAYIHPRSGRLTVPPMVRTWRATDADGKRTFEFIGPKCCDRCGWDLTKSPRDNIADMDPREWEQGVVVGTCLSHEGAEPADVLPADVAITFARCNLDNVVLHDAHKMGSTASGGGVSCSHNRVHVDKDGQDWICRWKDSGGKLAGSPVQLVDRDGAQRAGRNTDPERAVMAGKGGGD